MRLIDADALDAEMYHKSFEVDDGRNVWNSGLWIRYKIFEEAIRDAPTVDAVPVIRCKECRFYQGKYCTAWGDGTVAVACETDADGYCYLAEKERRMSYFQTMYGSDDLNTQFTDKDAHFGELVLRVIRDIECPMLMTEGEKVAVKKALIKALDEWAERKEE